jgi:hypothetical protein
MERELSRSGRRAVARAALAGVLVLGVLPAAASADKPADTPGNGPPATAGNPGHGPKATPHGQANNAPHGRAVRAHGAPAPHPAHPPVKTHPHAQSAPAPAAPHTNNGAAHQKTTICHATGSATNPYVQITISDRALKAHARHQDGRDIIPAPAGGCPTTAASGSRTAAATTGKAESGEATPSTSTSKSPAGASGTAGVVQTNRTVAARGSAGEGTSPAVATAADRGDDGTLPFTGLNLVLAILIAAGLVLAGIALRRAAAARRTTG